MNWNQRLARNLTAEAEAYGYTLSIWGGGAILLSQYSTPNVLQIYAYVGGALLGFAVLAAFAFRQLLTPQSVETDQQLIVASAIHLTSTLGNLIVSHFLAYVLSQRPSVPAIVGFGLVGFQVTVMYNLLLLIESFVAKLAVNVDLENA